MGGAWDRFTNPHTQKQPGFWKAFMWIFIGVFTVALIVDFTLRYLEIQP